MYKKERRWDSLKTDHQVAEDPRRDLAAKLTPPPSRVKRQPTPGSVNSVAFVTFLAKTQESYRIPPQVGSQAPPSPVFTPKSRWSLVTVLIERSEIYQPWPAQQGNVCAPMAVQGRACLLARC